MASALLRLTPSNDGSCAVMQRPRSASIMQEIGMFCLLALGIGLCLYFVSTALVGLGILSDINVNFGARAMLAYDGAPPKLENIGGIYPPMPFFLVLVFRDALLAAAIAGGAVLAAALVFIGNMRRQGRIGAGVEWVYVVSILALPQMLYVLTQRIDLCLTLCSFILTMWSIRIAEIHGKTYHLIICGLSMAFLYLCDTTTLLICLIFFPFIAHRGRQTHNSVIAVLVVTFLPLLFFAGVQRPMSLLITGIADPFAQWTALLHVSQNIASLEARPGDGHLADAALVIGRHLADNWMLLTPWFAAWGVVMMRGGIRLFGANLKYLTAPLLYSGYSIYQGTGIFESSSSALLIFPSMGLLVTGQQIFSSKNGPQRGNTVMALAMVLALVGGWQSMKHSSNIDEQRFYQAVFEQKHTDHWGDFMHILSLLGGPGEKGLVLMDTERNLPLVYFSGNPRRFLLPYQLDYEIGCSLPASYVEYVVVYGDPRYDGVLRKHPAALQGTLPGFACIATIGKRLVFKRVEATR